MRHHSLSILAVGTLALLAACAKQDDTPAVADADLSAQLDEKRAELEKLEADLAAQQQASTPPAPAPAPPAAAPSRPASTSTASTSKPAASKPAPAPKPVAVRSITVPSGTEIPLTLVTALSTKSSKVGETVQARVASNVVVDGRTAIAQGTLVAGSVVKVVSGSEKIGGTPTLVLAFDRIELANGKDVPITGQIESRGKSDNTRDTVKIVGGAAAGALLADQVTSKDKGKVIGGLLGAAAGAVAARETGTEVKLAEGAALMVVLGAAVEMPGA